MRGQLTQDGPHRRGISTHQFERQGNQLVIAFGHTVEHQVFKHTKLVRQQLVVAGQILAAGRVDAGCVDADKCYVFSS